MSLSGKRICVLTTGHLATSPRMTKAADAFAEAGARVHIISTSSTPWAVAADRDIVRRRPGAWTWDVVDYRARPATKTYLLSGVRQRSAKRLAALVGPGRVPLRIAGFARERVFPEIVRKASRIGADLVYGGGAGLAAAAFAGSELGVPFGVDLEDFHTGDQVDAAEGRLVQSLSGRIERDVLPRAAFRTAGSEDIAQAYRQLYGVDVISINNTYRLPQPLRVEEIAGPLRLYWFSQTIGPGRGLEDAIAALGVSGIVAELHLQGQAVAGYGETLLHLAGRVAPNTAVVLHPPAMSDDMVSECARYDVGLAIETDAVLNRRLCLTNKALAYVAAGLAVALTDTPGQRRLAADLGKGGFVYQAGDVRRLAEQLRSWSNDRSSLQQAKAASLAASRTRWHWDHPMEKGRLIAAAVAALEAPKQ